MCTTVISIITCSNCRRQLSSVYELTLQCKTFIETGNCPDGRILVVHSVEKEEEKKKNKNRGSHDIRIDLLRVVLRGGMYISTYADYLGGN
ncbi:hypothetical protein FCULG_00005701 [Fusarium culmorum]|uniref:Uncharacterized protein n=1 Tax=Fusarium culmorum TaxID=5516 RepID=A0A2T4GTT2_FUSCU|nr:hypothetical protein FCULG_00005701 [Fusarium culmorum]